MYQDYDDDIIYKYKWSFADMEDIWEFSYQPTDDELDAMLAEEISYWVQDAKWKEID